MCERNLRVEIRAAYAYRYQAMTKYKTVEKNCPFFKELIGLVVQLVELLRGKNMYVTYGILDKIVIYRDSMKMCILSLVIMHFVS